MAMLNNQRVFSKEFETQTAQTCPDHGPGPSFIPVGSAGLFEGHGASIAESIALSGVNG